MATMQEVATHAGVSIATVSFVVNGTKNVSPGTRARVEASMVKLGFRNNVVARALASRRTRIIALLFPALEHRFGSTISQFFMSAASRASELGYNLVIWPVGPAADDLVDLLSGGLVDGVVLMEVKMRDPRIDYLIDVGVPFTSIGRTEDPSRLPYVDVWFEQTVEEGIDYLATLGHENIALVIEDLAGTTMEGYGANVRTESSYLSSMARRGLRSTVVTCRDSTAGGRAAAHELVRIRPDVTAVMIMKDDATFGFVSGLASAGLAVPRDVSVLALSSSDEAAAATEPVLTTMNAPGHELGRLAVEALIEQLDGPERELPHILLPCVLHVADSTAVALPRS